MGRSQYSAEFQSNAVAKCLARGKGTIDSVAKELNISHSLLKSWLQASRKLPTTLPDSSASWGTAERLLALKQSYHLSGEALSQWCREKGIFEHQLKAWDAEFSRQASAAETAQATKKALQESERLVAQLKTEVARKNTALAETTALLVLSKKYQALISGEAL